MPIYKGISSVFRKRFIVNDIDNKKVRRFLIKSNKPQFFHHRVTEHTESAHCAERAQRTHSCRHCRGLYFFFLRFPQTNVKEQSYCYDNGERGHCRVRVKG